MKKVKSVFKIQDDKIIYMSKTFNDDIVALKKNADAWGEVTFEIIDKVAYFQHKYLHGYLLKDIAFALGETNTEYVKQFILKPKFLFRKVNDWKEIPSKYANKCRIIVEDNQVTGYIPSTTSLTFDEMKAFLIECENFLIFGLNGCVGMDCDEKNAMAYRDFANMLEEYEINENLVF